MRLTNFLMEVGGMARTGSAGALPGRNSPRDKMLAHSSASYRDGIKGESPHIIAMGSFLEQDASTQVNMFLSGDQNILRSNGSISFTGSLSALPAHDSKGQTLRSNLLFIAETNRGSQWLYTGSLSGRS